MLNQKGQAFSVFELMIAAIVAVAILFVLLPIVNQGFDFGSNAKNEIGNTLATVDSGGNSNSQPFTLTKGDIVTSKDFVSKGLDPHSVVFAIHTELSSIAGNFKVAVTGDSDSSDLTIVGDYSYLEYNGSNNFKAQASVYCQPTGTDLQSIIDDTSLGESILGESSNDSTLNVTTLCGEDTYQPCCIVLIKRG